MKAAMDIGTNSTRLLIATPEKIIHQETTITRIGEGLKEHQRIQDEPLARPVLCGTIVVLKKYKQILTDYALDEPGSHFLVADSFIFQLHFQLVDNLFLLIDFYTALPREKYQEKDTDDANGFF